MNNALMQLPEDRCAAERKLRVLVGSLGLCVIFLTAMAGAVLAGPG